MRLINEESLRRCKIPITDEAGYTARFEVVFDEEIQSAPTVDAEPVVHAHWEYDPNANDWGIGGWCCSKCHFKNDILGVSDKLPLPIKMYAGVRYCAQCGAKMDEVTKDET